MPAPFIIPFNFSPPVSPSVKTTSYTVPVGKYAQIRCYYEGTEVNVGTNASVTIPTRTITLNSITVLIPSVQGFGMTNAGAAVTQTATFPRVSRFECFAVSNPASGLFSYSGLVSGHPSVPVTGTRFLGVSSSFVFTDTGANTISVSGYIFSDTVSDVTFWAKAGDVITGTGNWRALVTEYNVIS